MIFRIVVSQPVSIDSIVQHFSTLGDLQYVRNRTSSIYCDAIIYGNFTLDENSPMPVVTSKEVIENSDSHIVCFDFSNQKRCTRLLTPEDLPTPPEDESSNILNILSDDVLLQIFTNLGMKELCSVAETCERFNEIAQRVFRNKYDTLKTFRRRAVREYGTILRIFGSSVKTLYFAPQIAEIERPHGFEVVRQYSAANLKVLKLFCDHGHLPQLQGFDELEVLSMQCHSSSEHKNFEVSFLPKLKEFNWYCRKGEGFEFVRQHIERNPHLLRLSLNLFIKEDILSFISETSTRLEEFRLHGVEFYLNENRFQNEVVHIARIKTLKSLAIDFQYNSAIPLLQALNTHQTPLETLRLSFKYCSKANVRKSSLVRDICGLKSLKCLELERVCKVSDGTLMELAAGLPNLTTFKLLSHNSPEQLITIAGVVNFVSHAEQLSHLTLQCSINDKSEQFDICGLLSISRIVEERNEPKMLTLEIASEILEPDVKFKSDFVLIKTLKLDMYLNSSDDECNLIYSGDYLADFQDSDD